MSQAATCLLLQRQIVVRAEEHLERAWELTKAWPAAQLHVVPDAGHSSMEPGIIDRLVQATDDFADKLGARTKA